MTICVNLKEIGTRLMRPEDGTHVMNAHVEFVAY